MESTRVATTPQQCALYVGWGVFLVLGGMPLTVIGGVLLGSGGELTGVLLAGLIVTVVGALVLSIGAFRWAEHVDRRAGVLAGYAPSAPDDQVESRR